MTTIAANRYEMAADSRTTWGNIQSVSRKIVRVNGALIASAGSDENGRIFVDWYARGAKRDQEPEFDLGDDNEGRFEVLILDGSGLWWCSHRCVFVPVEDVWAIGSGMEVALAMLRSGKTPRKAVETALLVDADSGPPVVVERL